MIASSLHTVIIILVMPRSPATVFPSLTAVLNSVEESVCNSGSVCSFPTHLSYKIVGGVSVRFKVGIKLKIRHEVRGCVVYDQCYVHTHTCGHTHAHLPHRAVTKPARLPPSLLAHSAIGNTGPVCPAWLAGQRAVCPGGLESLGLAAAAATDHSHLNSFPILTPGSTQSAASLGHSTTSSWRGNLKAGPVWITIWLLLVMLS